VSAFHLRDLCGRAQLQGLAFAVSLALGLALPVLPSRASDGPHLDRAAQDRQLSNADIKRYQEIFAVQAGGAWAEADALIAGLDNEILLGPDDKADEPVSEEGMVLV